MALEQLRFEIYQTMLKFGLIDPQARDLAEAVVVNLCHKVGGESFYINKKNINETQIKREFNGQNRDELCQKYNISKATFYRIIRS